MLSIAFQKDFITPESIDPYLQSISHLHPRSQGNRISVVRQFCQYIAQQKPHSYIPEPVHYSQAPASRIPYIYTPDQITKILQAARNLLPQDSIRPHTYAMFFGLLYTTGLRLSEALNLTINDLDLSSQMLYIRKGKFRKDRWVPLSKTTTEKLQAYLQERRKIPPRGLDAPAFINLHQRQLSSHTVYTTFRILLHQCQLRKRKGPGPSASFLVTKRSIANMLHFNAL